MWESILYTTLTTDTELLQYVSTYSNSPSIFSDSAPENVNFPYIVFVIENTSGPDSAVDAFNLTIHHYDFNESGKRSRLAIKRLISILDRAHLQHDDFKTIRLFKSWAGPAAKENEDRRPEAKHYMLRFTARAGRKGWIDDLIPDGD